MKPRPESACSRALSQHSTNQRASRMAAGKGSVRGAPRATPLVLEGSSSSTVT